MQVSKTATSYVLLKSALKNFANLQENTCARVSFLIKLQPEAYHHCGACGDRKNV